MEAKLKRIAREIADEMANFLRQEYKFHKGHWWLFTLGKPARPLLSYEIEHAKGRGLIPDHE